MNTRLMQDLLKDITLQGRQGLRHQARERQHRRRYRHGHHAASTAPRAPSSSTRCTSSSPSTPRRTARAISTSTTWTSYTLTTTCCQIDLHQALQGRLLHRPRLPARAQRHLQLRRAGLHRHPVQPERPARRSVASCNFDYGHGRGREQDLSASAIARTSWPRPSSCWTDDAEDRRLRARSCDARAESERLGCPALERSDGVSAPPRRTLLDCRACVGGRYGRARAGLRRARTPSRETDRADLSRPWRRWSTT